ncbi:MULTISPECIES: ABC transporter ATP-binding protein [Clostridia]|jgi:putative ABC transport system ATP-binding protein|uniref:ABC-type antimicrobial peptide transport system, ATPase component n=2 Tax=Acetivibrio TaxID=35829 RepID=G8M030_ACECE|nr:MULTISPECIES: ABC transporter ATP-binding protein [Clostridia]ADU75430.1 ABC transporter related protein [Acetivibrio thermocellus DSM 1313]AEV70137.1 ABC-type antimicrobial peptide transport system, ATPase component [Acetivibrio clariflavus DSM 19732]ALX09427.1 Phosphonate-transporting ATPase [Acetivibrio thermocellus AD2]ANV77181.1 Phosphonate-transporting ATPase [Acetivibrio thermocellus DSM 2360]EIC04551.1 ABC transporter related protein [Acetivibrio thermocellus YS]
MPILKTRDLTKIYPGAEQVLALNHVNLTVEKGELIAIMGDSGSGKSTLLHMLAGVDRPTEGQVLIQDVDITSLAEKEMAVFRRRNIGVIYQSFNLIPNITVEKNILLPLMLDQRKPAPTFFEEIIQTLGIGDKLKRFPTQLSGGEQQRVAIARSLVTRPAIILADEPTGNLDRRNTEEITSLFRLVNQRFQATILLVTHDEKVALSCERVMFMVDGTLHERKDLR